MATPKKKYPYAITYKDGTYLIYDITKEEYDLIRKALCDNTRSVELSFGIIVLDDVRSVIEQKPQPEPEPVSQKKLAEGDPVYLNNEEKEWLRAMREMGIDPEFGGFN